MSRRVQRLWKALPVSRETAAGTLAVCAVACLSSAIIHWSSRYPVEPLLWEQPLFGELSDSDADELQDVPLPVPEVVQRGGDAEPSPRVTHVRPEPPLHFPNPHEPPPRHRIAGCTHPFTMARFTEPTMSESHPIEVASHQASTDGEVVWLSGEIEEVSGRDVGQ